MLFAPVVVKYLLTRITVEFRRPESRLGRCVYLLAKQCHFAKKNPNLFLPEDIESSLREVRTILAAYIEIPL